MNDSKQYLVGKNTNDLYIQQQSHDAKAVKKENKDLRKQLKENNKQRKEDGMTQYEASRYGMIKSRMKKYVEEGKIALYTVGTKMYYSRTDVVKSL